MTQYSVDVIKRPYDFAREIAVHEIESLARSFSIHFPRASVGVPEVSAVLLENASPFARAVAHYYPQGSHDVP
jgi:hypothetical protein